MGKKKENEKKQVRQTVEHTSQEVASAVYKFTNILGGITVRELIENAQLIQKACGPDAEIDIDYDEYFGSSVSLRWNRLETDEELAKRLERSERARVAARKTSATNRKQKRVDELAELDRLQKKYPTK